MKNTGISAWVQKISERSILSKEISFKEYIKKKRGGEL